MDVKITLIALTMKHAQLHLMLPSDNNALPSASLDCGDPDTVANELASDLSGCSEGVQRHSFLAPCETGTEKLTLVYFQLLTEEEFQTAMGRNTLVPAVKVGTALGTVETKIVEDFVGHLKADLDQVMQSRLNKRGLTHLLGLLPDIFDHKELAAAYYALTGEKPSSPLMLARMMLDRYTMGSGERQREVKGRDLIEAYECEAEELLGEKWEKNKDLYRTGGPKAKRLYKKKAQ